MKIPAKRKKITLFLLSFVSVLLVFYLLLGFYFPKNKEVNISEIIEIKRGESVTEIAEKLKKEDLIRNKPLFYFYIFLTEDYKKIKAGKYLISPSESISQIVKKFISGETAKKKITIIEGWNLRDIGWYLENNKIAQAEELFELVGFPAINYSEVIDLPQPKDFSGEFEFLKNKPQNVGFEGYLFPDTYEISFEGEMQDVINKALKNFEKKVIQGLKEDILKQEKSLFEIITMASLLEKEVKTFEEKKIVSGILWKRLNSGVPLQVDATITYITEKRTTKIPKSDTEIDSYFNTYKYPGLPLGPICNPGLESIKAALYPESSVFWYYLTTPSGETKFSQTLKEHNEKKYKFLNNN